MEQPDLVPDLSPKYTANGRLLSQHQPHIPFSGQSVERSFRRDAPSSANLLSGIDGDEDRGRQWPSASWN